MPYSNKSIGFNLSHSNEGELPSDILLLQSNLGTGITDSNGYFTFQYTDTLFIPPHWDWNNTWLWMNISDHGFVVNLPLDSNLNFEYTIEDSTTLQVALQTDSVYSSDDTLYYEIRQERYSPADEGPYKYYIVGPFSDGLVNSVTFSNKWITGRSLYGYNYVFLWGVGYQNFYPWDEVPLTTGKLLNIQHYFCSVDTTTMHIP